MGDKADEAADASVSSSYIAMNLLLIFHKKKFHSDDFEDNWKMQIWFILQNILFN